MLAEAADLACNATVVSVHAEPGDCLAVLHTTPMHICMSGAQLGFGLLPFSVT